MWCYFNHRKSISSNMHKRLLKHMLSENLPFSVIVDGSADITDNHYLSVYFQILEGNVPVIVFYKLIELSSDLSGAGIYKSFENAFQDEEIDLFNYFRQNLIGFASDGEPTLTGAYNGLIAHIRNHVKNPIFSIHCMAHRLELIIKHTLTEQEYFTRFEITMNELFKFYNDYLDRTNKTIDKNNSRITYRQCRSRAWVLCDEPHQEQTAI